MRIPAALLTFAILATGCASATKRLEQGQELEQQGRSLDAARRYIDALRKDATLTAARQRLAETGAHALFELARQSDALAATGAHADAADILRTADALIHDAAGVNVALVPPAGYAERHTIVFAQAVDHAVAQAAAASRRGDFAESVRWVERAQSRWTPSSAQQLSLNRALRDAHIGWGISDMGAGRYRSAYTHGEAAASVPGFDRRETDALMADAEHRGTAVVAVFATTARAGVDNRLLPEVNDLLALEQWRRPPRWIDVLNPIEAQRIVRLRGLTGRELDTQDAASLGRQLGARFAVALTMDSVRYSESKVARHRRTARTRAGADTAYTIEEGELDVWARVSWRAVEVAAGRGVVDRGSVTDRASSQFRRATYAGNWRDLELSSSDRALFERDARDNQDMLRRAARGLSERLGREVYEALLRRVE